MDDKVAYLEQAGTAEVQERRPAYNHVSVDCVVMGFDGQRMNVLLIRRNGEEAGEEFHDMKLPGSIIYLDEDLDEAAKRVLFALTGLKKVNLSQFKAFGSKDRTKDPKDVHWLERAQQMKVERIVTIAYLSLVKIDWSIREFNGSEAVWVPLEEVPQLAFDHNVIVREAEAYVRTLVKMDPSLMFRLLPRRFTASQLRGVYCLLTGTNIDARNFYKKLAVMPYVVPLNETETKVAHRAARYFSFDKKTYTKTRI